jgi:hypothetical protein
MAMTEAQPSPRVSDATRPQPGVRPRAELLETPAGWVLTLTLDERTAEQFRAELSNGPNTGWFTPEDFSVSITPNLVPGGAFPLCAVEIIVE